MVDTPTELPRLMRVPGGAPDADGILNEVAEAAGVEPLRVRIQPNFYHYAERNYVADRGVSWQLELTLAQAQRLRADMDVFFRDWIKAQVALANEG